MSCNLASVSAANGSEGAEQRELVALSLTEPLVDIVPAPRRREWMETAKDRWPMRCLPLLAANESGWALLNPRAFEVVWDGRDHPNGVTIEFDGERPEPVPVTHHTGFGIIAWRIPYLFRTPPEYNLLARGPANWPVDGACALEGLIETDWAFASFGMTWKLTRPGHPVAFEEGFPFCVIIPQHRGELETFRPEIREISSDAETLEEFMAFRRNRGEVQREKYAGTRDLADWEGDYYRGLTPSGNPAPAHTVRRRLPEFTREQD
jgi:hypothetical protein